MSYNNNKIYTCTLALNRVLVLVQGVEKTASPTIKRVVHWHLQESPDYTPDACMYPFDSTTYILSYYIIMYTRL